MEHITPTQIIQGYFPETKDQQRTFVDQLISNTIDGGANPLMVETQMKNIEDVVKAYRSDDRVRAAVVNAFERRFPSQKVASYGSAELKLTEVGVKWDFTGCNDPVWNKLSAEMDAIKEALKERENILKANIAAWEYLDAETGETCTVYPPSKTSKTQVTVTIK